MPSLEKFPSPHLAFDPLTAGERDAPLVLPDIGHFAADQTPDRVSELLLQHIKAEN